MSGDVVVDAEIVEPMDKAAERLDKTVEIPPFPVDALPDPIKRMVDAVSLATQADPAFDGGA